MIEPRDERFSAWIDGELGPDELARLEAEFAADPRRRAEAEAFRDRVLAVREALAETVDRPPIGARERVLRRALEESRPIVRLDRSGGRSSGVGPEADGSRVSWFAVIGSLAAAGLFGALVYWAIETPLPPGARVEMAQKSGASEKDSRPEAPGAALDSFFDEDGEAGNENRIRFGEGFGGVLEEGFDEGAAESAFEESFEEGIRFIRAELDRQRLALESEDASQGLRAALIDEQVRSDEANEASDLDLGAALTQAEIEARRRAVGSVDRESAVAETEIAESRPGESPTSGSRTGSEPLRGGAPTPTVEDPALREQPDPGEFSEGAIQRVEPPRDGIPERQRAEDDFFLSGPTESLQEEPGVAKPAVLALLSPRSSAPKTIITDSTSAPSADAGAREFRTRSATNEFESAGGSVAVVELITDPARLPEVERVLIDLLTRASDPTGTAGEARVGRPSDAERVRVRPRGQNAEPQTEEPDDMRPPAGGLADTRSGRRGAGPPLRSYFGRQVEGGVQPVGLFELGATTLAERRIVDTGAVDGIPAPNVSPPEPEANGVEGALVSLIEGPTDRILGVLLAIDRRLRQVDAGLEFQIVEPTETRRPATLYYVAVDESLALVETPSGAGDSAATAPTDVPRSDPDLPEPVAREPLRFVIRLAPRR